MATNCARLKYEPIDIRLNKNLPISIATVFAIKHVRLEVLQALIRQASVN